MVLVLLGIAYYSTEMNTQLLYDLTGDAKGFSVRFCEKADIESIRNELDSKGVSVLEVDGLEVNSIDDLFRVVAIAFRTPKNWYGDEEFAPNANAFLEYIDDVVEWIRATGYVLAVKNAEVFWQRHPRIAAELVELWQCATNHRKAKPHLLFVW